MTRDTQQNPSSHPHRSRISKPRTHGALFVALFVVSSGLLSGPAEAQLGTASVTAWVDDAEASWIAGDQATVEAACGTDIQRLHLVGEPPNGAQFGVVYDRKVSCARVEIEGCGDPITATLQKVGPEHADEPQTPLGTVIFGTGGAGSSHWFGSKWSDGTLTSYPGADLADLVAQAGYTAISRAWPVEDTTHGYCSLSAGCLAGDFEHPHRKKDCCLSGSSWDDTLDTVPGSTDVCFQDGTVTRNDCEAAGGTWFFDSVSVWSGTENHRQVFCRYATLITALQRDAEAPQGRWVDDGDPTTPMTLGWHQPIPGNRDAFCAVGQSGGGGEISGALAFHGREAILDLAIVSGAMPFGDPQVGLLNLDPGPTWGLEPRVLAEHVSLDLVEGSCRYAFQERGVCLEGPGSCNAADGGTFNPDRHCFYGDSTAWLRINSAYERSQDVIQVIETGEDLSFDVDYEALYNGSSMALGDLDYPTTAVVYVLGDQNESSDPVLGHTVMRDVMLQNDGDPPGAVLEVIDACADPSGTHIHCVHNVHLSFRGGFDVLDAHLLGKELATIQQQRLYDHPFDGEGFPLTHGFGCVDRSQLE